MSCCRSGHSLRCIKFISCNLFVCCHTPESPPSVSASSSEAEMANSEGTLTDRRRNAVYLLPNSFRLVLNFVNYGQSGVRSRLPVTRIISSLMFDPPVCQTRKGPESRTQNQLCDCYYVALGITCTLFQGRLRGDCDIFKQNMGMSE